MISKSSEVWDRVGILSNARILYGFEVNDHSYIVPLVDYSSALLLFFVRLVASANDSPEFPSRLGDDT
jgi:hypothetical protein